MQFRPWQTMSVCTRREDGIKRAAALVWTLNRGIAWIEPQYLQPGPYAGFVYHEVEGTIDEESPTRIHINGWLIEHVGDDISQRIKDHNTRVAIEEFHWWRTELDKKGRTIDQERARLASVMPELKSLGN